MRSRVKVKKRTLPSKKDRTAELRRKVEKEVQRANQRIKSINKKYKGTTYTWSINKLKNKLDNYVRKERVVIPKKITNTELIKIYKEVESFLNSKQSTKTGIRTVQEKAKTTIKQTFHADDSDVSDEDVDTYYKMFEDDAFNNFVYLTGITPSELMVIIDDAIRDGDTQDEFLDRLKMYTTIADEEVRNAAIRLYEKYVK